MQVSKREHAGISFNKKTRRFSRFGEALVPILAQAKYCIPIAYSKALST
jgi:hypothetical protein